MIVTRIAPSPTGLFHLGTARTAYFNWLMARANQGKFIVRIDDTDLDRNNEEFVKLIYDSLEWLGLDYDLTFAQSERLGRYCEVAKLLVDHQKATIKDDGSIDFIYDGEFPATWNDFVIGSVKASLQDQTLSSKFTIMRHNGMPTYNFSTVVDDMDFGITHVIRGSDHISNTLRQVFLRSSLNEVLGTHSDYQFGHIGLIHKDGKKLSKRDGAADLLTYKREGYEAEDILAYILKLGWNVPDANIDRKHPIIGPKLALTMFNNGKMRGAAVNFDQNKLEWVRRKRKYD